MVSINITDKIFLELQENVQKAASSEILFKLRTADKLTQLRLVNLG